jgi:hypothetical protein
VYTRSKPTPSPFAGSSACSSTQRPTRSGSVQRNRCTKPEKKRAPLPYGPYWPNSSDSQESRCKFAVRLASLVSRCRRAEKSAGANPSNRPTVNKRDHVPLKNKLAEQIQTGLDDGLTSGECRGRALSAGSSLRDLAALRADC